MSNENFIREIDEELRSDQMRSLWRNFGPWIIAAAVLLVVGVAGYEAWNWWQNSNSARASDQFYAALNLADGTDAAAAQKALDEVAAQGVGGYPALAHFREAALLAKDGKPAEAMAAYDAIATGQANAHLRDLALTLAAFTAVDSGDVAAVEQRVSGLTAANNPMRNAAREALGLAKYKAGDLNGALAEFQAVLADPFVSREAQSRLSIYEAQLTAEGAVAATDATPASPAVPATEAPADGTTAPSVGDAPELDTTPPAAPADGATAN